MAAASKISSARLGECVLLRSLLRPLLPSLPPFFCCNFSECEAEGKDGVQWQQRTKFQVPDWVRKKGERMSPPSLPPSLFLAGIVSSMATSPASPLATSLLSLKALSKAYCCSFLTYPSFPPSLPPSLPLLPQRLRHQWRPLLHFSR